MVCLSLSIIWWQLAAVTSIHRKPVSLPSTMEVSTDTRYRYRSNPSRNLNLCWLSQSVSNTARWSTSLVYMYGSSICRAGAQNKDGFVYFGMHGALPVYSLKRSSVEGKIMIRWLSYIMPSDSTSLSRFSRPNVDDACPTPSPGSLFSLRNPLLSSSVHLHMTISTWGHYGLTLPPQCLCQNITDANRVLKSCHRNNTITITIRIAVRLFIRLPG